MPSEYQNQDNQTAFILFSVEKYMLSATLFPYFLWKTRLEFLRSIDGIPPCWLVLQVLVEPCKHGVDPLDTLVIVHDTVVFTLHYDECCRHAEELEGCVHLDTLTDWHVGVSRTVGEEQWLMYLVSIEER